MVSWTLEVAEPLSFDKCFRNRIENVLLFKKLNL